MAKKSATAYLGGAGCIGNVYPAAGRAGPERSFSGKRRQFPAAGAGSAAGHGSGQPEYGSKLAGHGIYPVQVRAARRMGMITSVSAPGSPWKAAR